MADLFNQAKNLLSGRNPNEDKPESADNRIDRNDQCKVVWYQWVNELGTDTREAFHLDNPLPALSGDDAKLADSRSYDISNHITNFTYSKSLGGAAGSFSFTLENSFDWTRFMRPGQWVCIYLTGSGDLPLPIEMNSNPNSLKQGNITPSEKALNAITSALGINAFSPLPELPLPKGPDAKTISSFKNKLRCMGIIQRVGIKSITTVDGAVETSFTVTGKDFGGIYEETELWFNANHADGETFSAAVKSINTQFSRNLTSLLGKWHDIFVNPNSVLPKSLSNVSAYFPDQWILPSQMVKDLDLKMQGLHFGDIIDLKEFSPTGFENPDPNLLSGLEGRAWDRLKNCSQPEFHELFTELSDNGNPRLYFRPIPWAMDKSRYPALGNLTLTYAELASGNAIPPKLDIPDIKTSLLNLADGFGAQSFGASEDARTFHSLVLSATEVESFDVGPDFHSRANFFLVEASRSALDQKGAFATISPRITGSFPFRNERDIKRHGFRPLFISLQTFNISKQGLFAEFSPYGNDPSIAFMLECNEILRDYYANAEDMYSGTLNLAIGKSSIKLGKVILTDDTFQGISNMVFYIEGYSDSFSINGDGVATWTQTVNVTRGIQQHVLKGGSTKDKEATQVGTFHVFNKASKREDSSTLGKIKNTIKKPF